MALALQPAGRLTLVGSFGSSTAMTVLNSHETHASPGVNPKTTGHPLRSPIKCSFARINHDKSETNPPGYRIKCHELDNPMGPASQRKREAAQFSPLKTHAKAKNLKKLNDIRMSGDTLHNGHLQRSCLATELFVITVITSCGIR